MPDAAAQAAVEAAITSRRSIRAFLPKPVPQAEVAHLLDVAARAPSGSNIQPWRVYAQSGAALKRRQALAQRYRKSCCKAAVKLL